MSSNDLNTEIAKKPATKDRKQVIKHLLTYGLGTAADAAAAFFVTPILAHTLSTSDYGVLELLNRSAAIIYGLVGTAICQAFFRFYLDKDDPKMRGAVVTMTFNSMAAVLSLAVLLIYCFRSMISTALWHTEAYSYAVFLAAIVMAITLLFRIGMVHLQATMKSSLYVACSILNGFGMIVACWVAVSKMGLGLKGAILSQIIVTSVLGAVLFASAWFKHTHVINKPLAKEMLRFAAPFVPSAALAWVLHNIDRYWINQLYGASETGIYSLGWKIGFSVALVSEPVMRLWTPHALTLVQTKGGQFQLGKYISYVFGLLCCAGLALSLFAPEIVRLMSAKEYWEAYKVVPIVTAAYAVWGVCSMSDIGIIVSKRTVFKPLIFLAACIVSILGNMLAVPKFGMLAAAWTCLSAMIVFYLLQAYITNKIYPIGLKLPSMCVSFSIGICAYLIASGSSVLIRVVVLILCVIAHGAFLLFCRRRWAKTNTLA